MKCVFKDVGSYGVVLDAAGPEELFLSKCEATPSVMELNKVSSGLRALACNSVDTGSLVNMELAGELMYGPVVFYCISSGGEKCDLTEEQLESLEKYIAVKRSA